MSIFGAQTPQAPAPPPPPPNPPQLAQASIAEQGAAERASLSSAAGGGFNGQDMTGGQGVTGTVNTTANQGMQTKSLLGG